MWEIEFYVTGDNKEVIEEFLEELPEKHRAKAFHEIDLLSQFGIKLKQPHAKHIEEDLWELRIKYSSDISRIFYFIPVKKKIVLLHGFIKKTEKTPPKQIKVAKERMVDYKRRFKI